MISLDEYSLEKIANNYFDRCLLDNEANKTLSEYIKAYSSQVKEEILTIFTIRNEEVATFFVDNDDFILMLQKVEPIVRKFFPDEELVLEFVPDPDWIGQLVLYIQTNINGFNIDDLYNKIEKIENESRILLNEDMKKKFLIDVE